MVRMSDIFKKALENKEVSPKHKPLPKEPKKEDRPQKIKQSSKDFLKPKKPVSHKVSFSKIKKEPQIEKDDDKSIKQDIDIAQLTSKRSEGLNDEETVILYKDAVALIADIYEKLKHKKDTDKEKKIIFDYLEKFIDLQIQGDDRILSLLHLSDKDYPYDQVINVCLMAIEIGIGLGYNKSSLVDLGIVSFLHKISMVKIHLLGTKVHKESKDNLSFAKNSITIDGELIAKFENIADKFISSAYTDLENIARIGHPKGLDDEIMFDYSRIIGLANLYEVWAYPGNRYGKMYPHDVLSLIIRIKNSFGKSIVKAFIKRISCPFPVGTYVKLSSGEEAMVIGRNLGHPLNPIVEVFDEDSDRPLDERIVDLNQYPTVHIQSYLKK